MMNAIDRTVFRWWLVVGHKEEMKKMHDAATKVQTHRRAQVTRRDINGIDGEWKDDSQDDSQDGSANIPKSDAESREMSPGVDPALRTALASPNPAVRASGGC
jgi:hypothetical protein